jgi:hypothetical protein
VTDRIALPQPDPRRSPYLRLLPVAEALLRRGYTQSRPGQGGGPFGPSKAGYEAHFAEPLDIAWLRTTFDLPETIRYDPDRDELLDTETYTAIVGSRPAESTQANQANQA